MSVLGLDSGYTAEYDLNPLEFPWAAPSGTEEKKTNIFESNTFTALLFIVFMTRCQL